MKIIAHIENDFSTKFGIPRQSGLVNSLRSRIVFAPEYRNPDAFRGLEDFSHVWLIWEFSQAVRQKWSPTVRPPRLGGNTRMGVFATRSPFRPNPVGLSAVQLEEVVLHGADAPYLVVSGADLMNGTPIYDIKPYLPHIDSHPDARGGFAVPAAEHRLYLPEFQPDPGADGGAKHYLPGAAGLFSIDRSSKFILKMPPHYLAEPYSGLT